MRKLIAAISLIAATAFGQLDWAMTDGSNLLYYAGTTNAQSRLDPLIVSNLTVLGRADIVGEFSAGLITVDGIIGNPTNHPPSTNASTMFWSSDDEAWKYQSALSNVVLEVGSIPLRVFNNTTSAILASARAGCVRITGSTNGVATVETAIANDPSRDDVIGYAVADIDVDSFGIVLLSGKVPQDTSIFGANDRLYLQDIEGTYSNEPASTVSIQIGYVLDVGTNGSIFVNNPIVANLTILGWSASDLQSRDANAFGTVYENETTGQTIDPGPAYTLTTYNRHIIFDVTSLTTTGAVTFSGTRVDETNGDILTNQVETIQVTGTGYYQTAFKWVDPTDVEAVAADFDADFYTSTYLDFQNQDFILNAMRIGWRPSNPSWRVRVEVLKVNNDGSITDLTEDIFDFDNSDSPPRAANGILGSAKKKFGAGLILGSENEGIVVNITGPGGMLPSNIRDFDLTIGAYVQ